MAIDHGMVMGAVASAAGGSTALGIGFVTISAAVLKVSNAEATAPASLVKAAMIAFLAAMAASFLAVAWLIFAAWMSDAWFLEPVYWISIILFAASALIFLVVFAIAVRLLWNASTTVLLTRLRGPS